MYKNSNESKIIITMQELMEQMDVSDKTLHRMIEEGDLPDFTYGSKWTKKKGWHAAVLERHAMDKYEQSNSFKNVSDISQVRGKDMAVMPLSSRHGSMSEQGGNLDNRNPSKQKRSCKKMSGGVRPTSSQSRISTGFTNMPT